MYNRNIAVRRIIDSHTIDMIFGDASHSMVTGYYFDAIDGTISRSRIRLSGYNLPLSVKCYPCFGINNEYLGLVMPLLGFVLKEQMRDFIFVIP